MNLEELDIKDSTYSHLWDYLIRAKKKDLTQIRTTPRLIGRPDFNISKRYRFLANIRVEKIQTIGDFRVKPGDAIIASWGNGKDDAFSINKNDRYLSYPQREIYGVIILVHQTYSSIQLRRRHKRSRPYRVSF